MRRTLLALMFPATMLVGSVAANPAPPSLQAIMRLAMTSVSFPHEWDGVWAVAETTYDCNSAFEEFQVGNYSFCGQEYTVGMPGVTYTCTGDADATTFNVTCTGSGYTAANCYANSTLVAHGTRVDDTSFIVTSMDNLYSGSGCWTAEWCFQSNDHGTRTGPPSPDFCATPTRRSTWGSIKAIYR